MYRIRIENETEAACAIGQIPVTQYWTEGGVPVTFINYDDAYGYAEQLNLLAARPSRAGYGSKRSYIVEELK